MMGAFGFHRGRCCRSRRLRKQSRGTFQTVPPGYGSPTSCEGVRSARQRQIRCTLEKRIQWILPWARRPGTARCGARFERAPRMCRDGRSRPGCPSSQPGRNRRTPGHCLKSSSTLFTQPPAAAASSMMEPKGSYHARRSDQLISTVQVSNLHLQFSFFQNFLLLSY